MVIQWSDEDQAYVVTLPEWEAAGHACRTHGNSYADAAAKGKEMLSFVLEAAREEGDAIPEPALLSVTPSVNDTAQAG